MTEDEKDKLLRFIQSNINVDKNAEEYSLFLECLNCRSAWKQLKSELQELYQRYGDVSDYGVVVQKMDEYERRLKR